MKKLTFFLISLLTVFAFAACSDGLDNIEYNRNSDIVIVTPEVTTVTGTSLTVTSSVTGNINQVVKKGFCYSINAQNPTIKDNIVDADENFSATISGLTAIPLTISALTSTVTAVIPTRMCSQQPQEAKALTNSSKTMWHPPMKTTT